MVRTFRDTEVYAYEAAAYLKARAPADLVQVVNRAQKTLLTVNADGRVLRSDGPREPPVKIQLGAQK